MPGVSFLPDDPLLEECRHAPLCRKWQDELVRRGCTAGPAAFEPTGCPHSLDDLVRLRSVGLHKLRGNRAGQWAITINGPWRLVFRFEVGNAEDVEIVDYH